MSEVIGQWIIGVQDAMPDKMRNSAEWKSLLPLAAGTGRQHEAERLAIILDWMWSAVLPHLQSQADAGGYGAEWQCMTTERTAKAAAEAAAAAAWADAWAEAWAARAAAEAKWAAWADAAAADAARAAKWASWSVVWAARADAAVVWAVRADAPVPASMVNAAWAAFDPCGLLERLINLGENT